jgi:hypothetical protein
MNLLFRVIYAAHCRGTHHKLAMDGLRLMTGPEADLWRGLFLAHHEMYLSGSKEPDDEFKDFVNHVLHVEQNHWGGAIRAADRWYYNTVRSLQNGDWDHAARAAGVLSHYVVDPIMPFHTGQSVAENNIHRAVEWSISKSYDELVEVGERQPTSVVLIESVPDWLSRLMIRSAEMSHAQYQTLIDHYDFDAGVKNPQAGLNATSREVVANLLVYAMNVWARVLERVIVDSGIRPPAVDLQVATVLASIEMPIKWVTNRLADAADRSAVKAIYEELRSTGKVEANLPEECRVIRREMPTEVRPPVRRVEAAAPVHKDAPIAQPTVGVAVPQVSMPMSAPAAPKTLPTPASPPKVAAYPDIPIKVESKPVVSIKAEKASPEKSVPEPVGAEWSGDVTLPITKPSEVPMSGLPKGDRFFLSRSQPVVDAPSIGPKLAGRLKDIGIETVDDLMEIDPADIATELQSKHINDETVRQWQEQAALVCQVPGLRGHDAQILVGSGYRSVEELAAAEIGQMAIGVQKFLATPEAERLLRHAKMPERAEMIDWIRSAARARPLRAA